MTAHGLKWRIVRWIKWHPPTPLLRIAPRLHQGYVVVTIRIGWYPYPERIWTWACREMDRWHAHHGRGGAVREPIVGGDRHAR